MRVLVVDDDPAIRRLLRRSLAAHRYAVFEEETGRGALQAAAKRRLDVMILALGLPDMDGLEVTRTLRAWSKLPVVVLSVHESEAATIAALDAGADDYLTKPFGIGELMARLRVAVRHSSLRARDHDTFRSADLAVDFRRRVVKVRGQETLLTPTEYALLRLLIQHEGKVLPHAQMLTEVWGPGHEHQTHMLQVHISNLRNKLEPQPVCPYYILTEAGVGYRLRASIELA